MYAVLSDLINAIGEDRLLRIADRNGNDEIDADVVAEALLDASAEIDAAVTKRYKLPFDPVPRLLRRLAIDIAHYHLDLDPTDDLRKRVEAARASLKMIAKGDMVLDDAELAASGSTPATGGASDNAAAVGSFQSSLDTGGFET